MPCRIAAQLRRPVVHCLAALGLVVGCSDSHVSPAAIPEPVRLTALTDTALSAVVARRVVPVPTVRLTTTGGVPISGRRVLFSVQGGGRLTETAAVTDADGRALASAWMLGTVVGTNALTVRVADDPSQSVTFRVATRADTAAEVTVLDDGALIGFFGEPLVNPLIVLVSDTFGNPVAGVPVVFRVLKGGGVVSAGSVTDAGGMARASWTLGPASDQEVGVEAAAARTTLTATAYARCVAQCGTASEIIFARNGDIFSMRSDGSGLRQLTTGGHFADPAVSRDGSRIAFADSRAVGGVSVMNADGSGARLVVPGGRAPALSPDGRLVAYALPGDAAGAGGVYVTSVDGGGTAAARRIGMNRGQVEWPAWSPDGSSIALVGDYAAFDFAMEVYLATANGADYSQLTNGFFENIGSWPAYTTYYQPAWSPDGKRLAVVTCGRLPYASCSTSSLSVIDLSMSGGRDLVVRKLADTEGLTRPAWLSTSEIMFGRRGSIFTINVDGRGERLLIAGASTAVAKR